MSSGVEFSGSGQENASNATLSCYSLKTAPTAAIVAHTTVLTIITILSLAGNGLVLVLVARYKKLRTRNIIVGLSMVVADMLFTLSYTLPALVTTALREWPFGNGGCIAFGFLGSDLLMTRWIIVGLLCFDRFCTVRFPFSYNRRGKCLMTIFSSIAWVAPVIISAIPIHTFADFKLRENNPICLPACTGTLNGLCRIYYAFVFTLTYISGSIVPITLYSWLYNKGRKLNKSVKQKLGYYTVQIANGISVSRPLGEHHTDRREKQATVTFMLIFVTVVITGSPVYLLQVLRVVSTKLHCMIPIYVHFVMIEFFLCAPMLTPLVIMRDRAFRESIANQFCCGRKTSGMQVGEKRSLSPEQKSFSSFSLQNQSRRSSIAATTTTAHTQECNTNRTANNATTQTTISESDESVSSV